MTPTTDLLFNMVDEGTDLFYFPEDGNAYFNGIHGIDHQDFELVDHLIKDEYLLVKENGRCKITKKGANHLKKHLGVRI